MEASLCKLLEWRTLLSVKVYEEPLRGATLEVKKFNCYQVNSFDEKKKRFGSIHGDKKILEPGRKKFLSEAFYQSVSNVSLDIQSTVRCIPYGRGRYSMKFPDSIC